MTRDTHWFALYAGYFALQALIRALVGPALELDEAEAIYFARHLALGYNAQPPLYFWLQWALFQIFGPGIPALALLKALLLTGFAVSVHLLMRQALPVITTGIAVLALSLLPQIVWESQRALTHSVLVLMMTGWSALALWRALQDGRWGLYLAFGLTFGLGLLSKYNFALLPGGLILATLILPATRARLYPGRLIAGLALGLAVAVPPALWALAHPDLAGGSLHKLGFDDAAGWIGARITGLGAMIAALLAFLALAILALVPAGWRHRRALADDLARGPILLRWLALGVVLGVLALLAGLLASGATEVKDRWLLPLVWPLVPVAVALIWPRLGRSGARTLATATALLWLVAMAGLPWASLRDPGYRAADFGPLMARIADEPAVATDMVWIAGNLIHAGHPGAVHFPAFPDGTTGPMLRSADERDFDLLIPHGDRSQPVRIEPAP